MSWTNTTERKRTADARLKALKGGHPSGRADQQDSPKRVDDQDWLEDPSGRVYHLLNYFKQSFYNLLVQSLW